MYGGLEAPVVPLNGQKTQENKKGSEVVPLNIQKTQENRKEPETAKQEAENALEAKETKTILDKMKKIEDYINNIPDEKLNIYKWIVLEYKSIKDDIKQKMEEDPNFQEAMKQVWEHLDKNDQPLDTIGEPTAWEIAWEFLINNETPKQIKKANYVMSWYDKLNPKQQEALNGWLVAFKDRIENVATQLWLNQQNYEAKKVA